MSNQLTFNTTTLTPIIRNGQTYLTSSDLATILEYKDPKSVTRIYARNSDEFSNDMSMVVNLTPSKKSSNLQVSTRIFNLRGSHLIAMFANTKVAKQCRKWILDLIEKEMINRQQEKTTVDQRTALRNAVNMLVSKKGIMYPEAYHIIHQRFNVEHIEELTLEQVTQAIEYIHNLCFDKPTTSTMLSEKDAESLIWLWFALYQCLDLINDMAPALRALQSPLGTKAISFSSCYKETLNHSHKVVNKLTQDLNASDGMALPIFRDYQPKGIGAIAL